MFYDFYQLYSIRGLFGQFGKFGQVNSKVEEKVNQPHANLPPKTDEVRLARIFLNLNALRPTLRSEKSYLSPLKHISGFVLNRSGNNQIVWMETLD